MEELADMMGHDASTAQGVYIKNPAAGAPTADAPEGDAPTADAPSPQTCSSSENH